MWGVLCSPNHNSLNFYGIPKGQPKIPHFLSSNFIFSRWKHLPMYRKQTLEQCRSIFLFMAYFYFTAGVTKFKEKLGCRMDVVFFKSDWYNVWKLLHTLEIVSRLKNSRSRTIILFYFWVKPNWMILMSFLINFMIRHLTYSCSQKIFIKSF